MCIRDRPMTASDTSIDLTYFNHPVKAVHIAAFGSDATHTFDSASMYINGTPLFENMTQEYHRIVVPNRHRSVLSDGGDDMPITSWPFCLTMNKSQPTGTLNFSRIDSAKITLDTVGGSSKFIRAYAVNYNILRIKNGMGGVAFGN